MHRDIPLTNKDIKNMGLMCGLECLSQIWLYFYHLHHVRRHCTQRGSLVFKQWEILLKRFDHCRRLCVLLLFALGIIGTGMLAIPVLAGSTAYAVSESLDGSLVYTEN